MGETSRALVRNKQSVAEPLVISWKLSIHGQWKLNVDGARCSSDRRASCCEVIRDGMGVRVTGFSKFIGRCFVLELKLWGIYEGLKCARSLNLHSLVVESDCLDVIRMMNNINDYVTSSTLIGHIKVLLDFLW
ncbi:hypothetical protein V6N11_027275 [Hibiscus sabdariffa]|uniref:RNase H type-1 domain-containing protein n=1 Tax=Hibiscus sabdariffa TaxID=183260 RepID=A0ABR2PH58_9ROSI